MNWLDIILVIVALTGLIIGRRVGLIGAVVNAVGVFVGIWIAARFSDDISAWFTEQGSPDAIATVLAFAAIIIGILVATQAITNVVRSGLRLIFLGWVDSIGAIGVGLLLGLIMMSAIIMGAARFSTNIPEASGSLLMHPTTGIRGTIQEAIVESKIIPPFIDIALAIPADTFGLIPNDFRDALYQLSQIIDTQPQ